jgi:hypothetical protein
LTEIIIIGLVEAVVAYGLKELEQRGPEMAAWAAVVVAVAKHIQELRGPVEVAGEVQLIQVLLEQMQMLVVVLEQILVPVVVRRLNIMLPIHNMEFLVPGVRAL